MALAKEQQRLHKKTIIARVGHSKSVLYCRMYQYFVNAIPTTYTDAKGNITNTYQ